MRAADGAVAGPGRRSPWFARLVASAHAQVRLLCFPPAGGGAATYRAWARILPPQVELCSVRLPGRESRLREPPLRDLRSLVAMLAPELERDTSLPVALFGHCSGALVAFELARQLRREGRPVPVRLFASAFPAPQIDRRPGGVHTLPSDRFVEHLRGLGGVPPAILADRDLLALFEAGLRADFEIFETAQYLPGEPLDAPITVFGGRDDPTVEVGALLAWRQQTRGELTLRLLPTGHFFLEEAGTRVVRAIVADLGLPGAAGGTRPPLATGL